MFKLTLVRAAVLTMISIGSLCVPSGPGMAAAVLNAADPNIQYTGRWDFSSPLAPWAYAKSSSIIVRFHGTSIAIQLATGSSDYYRVIVDGDAAGSTKIQIPTGMAFPLVSGLADATHDLEIVKETDIGRATLTSFELDDGRALAPPPAQPTRRIVFYGDSNLAGYSLESERNQGSANLLGSYYTYAGITGRMFDAEIHNISKSGATITKGANGLQDRFDDIQWGTNSPWNFALFPADVVVVNIGANDVGRSETTIKGEYDDLLADLRAAHPSSHVVLFNAYGWDFSETANYTDEVIVTFGDPNTSVATFPWLFERFHGCETDHAGMAAYLAAHIQTVTGWVPGPSDVVSGYGLNGQVANRSFEERAPFGGWGWRYFDDPGVTRVEDPLSAYNGDYFLRLEDGAASQQTNPSFDGEEVSLSVWMRGGSPGDEADVTIEFRDQGGGADPSSSAIYDETHTQVLSSTWQQYTVSVTAPDSPPNPVFSSRVIFEAGPGSTVDVDFVLVPEPSQLLALGVGVFALAHLDARRRRARSQRPSSDSYGI